MAYPWMYQPMPMGDPNMAAPQNQQVRTVILVPRKRLPLTVLCFAMQPFQSQPQQKPGGQQQAAPPAPAPAQRNQQAQAQDSAADWQQTGMDFAGADDGSDGQSFGMPMGGQQQTWCAACDAAVPRSFAKPGR